MTIKIFFVVVLFNTAMTRSDISQECIFHSCTVLLKIVQVDDEFVTKGCVVYIRRLRGCLDIQSCGIIKIHLNRILSFCKKQRVGYNKDLNLGATILFCNGHKLRKLICFTLINIKTCTFNISLFLTFALFLKYKSIH